jgi:hypothetical protein
MVASIGMDPPIPVLEQGVTFTPRVEGAKANESLSYRWQLDGQILCETAMCAWGEALEGSHTVLLEVRGEGERIAVEQRDFEVVTLVDEEAAGFRIVGLGCNSGVSSDETLACTLGLERNEGIGALNVTWLIDGVVASTEAGVQAGSEMQLGQPAPGEHMVEGSGQLEGDFGAYAGGGVGGAEYDDPTAGAGGCGRRHIGCGGGVAVGGVAECAPGGGGGSTPAGAAETLLGGRQALAGADLGGGCGSGAAAAKLVGF